MRHLKIDAWMPIVLPIVLLIVYIYALFMILPIFSESDPAWHLAAGDYIRQNGIPQSDPWAFTSGGVPWYNLSWGFDVFISYCHGLFGFAGLYLLMPIILTAVVGVCFLNCKMRGVSVQAASIICLLAGLALSTSTALRPQLVTFLLIAVLHYFLHRDSVRKDKVAWIMFPLISLIWSNMHGGVIALFIVAGCYGLQYLIDRDWAQARRLMVIGGICACTVLITPFGAGIFHAMAVSIISIMNANIIEWWPLIPFMLAEQAIFLCLFLLVSNFRNNDVPQADRFIVFLWLLFTLRSRRHFPLFVILSIPYVAMSLDKFCAGNRIYEWFSRNMQIRRAEGITAMGAAAVLAIAISSLYIHIVPQKAYTMQNPALGQAVEYIAAKYPNSRVFNRFNDGGHIIYLAKGRFKIAIDGRIDTAYPPEYMAQYREKIDYVQDGWMDVVKTYDPQIFLLPEGSKMEKGLREFANDWVWEKEFKMAGDTYYVIVAKALHSVQ